MKLISTLKGFKNYFDLKATLTNKKGTKVIDTVSKSGDFNGKFTFKFNKNELPGKKSKKKSNLMLTIESLNDSDETNLVKKGDSFTFDPLEQSDKFKLKRSKKTTKLSFSPKGNLIESDPEDPTDTDKTGPVFTSPKTVDPIIEGITAGQAVYLAQATDESLPIKYSVTGKDANSFNVNSNTGSIALKVNTDHSKQSNYGFNVVATDNKGNSTNQALKLLINKDLPPTFVSPKTVDPIKEGSAKGTVIYSASANDAGGPVTYSLTGPDAASFQIAPNTGVVVTQTELNHDIKTSYSFNVVATDSGFKKQQTVLPLTLQITKAGATLQKISDKDILPPQTTKFSDTITCEIGTFGLSNTIQDLSTTDQDEILIKTNQFSKFQDIFAPFGSKFINIENFKIEALNDTSLGDSSLQNITNAKSFSFVRPSTFTSPLQITSWGTTGITNYNFAGITSTAGVSLLNASSNLPANNNSITVSGTSGPDTFEGLAGDVQLIGGLGTDTLTGSTAGKSTIAGGGGLDAINFVNLAKQNTVDLSRQTTSSSKDTVTGFVGATAVNKANGSFDLIQINDGSFPNYTAGSTLTTKTKAEALASPSLANTVIVVPNRVDITSEVLPNAPKGVLAYATNSGTLHYAPTGNFLGSTENLLDIGGGAAVPGFSVPDQIQVISGVG